MRGTILLLALTVGAGACGDDDGMMMGTDAGSDAGIPPGDGGGVDAGASPDDGGTATDGGATTDGGMVETCTLGHLLVTTTSADFTESSVGILDVISDEVETDDIIDDTDTLPTLVGCEPVLMERASGTLRFQRDDDLFTTDRAIDLNPEGATDPYSVNPHAIALVDDTKAYVAALSLNELLIVDPTLEGSAAVTGSVDLSGFLDEDDTDGLVDAADVIVVGDRAYVGLGNYWFDDSFAIHFEGSLLAVVDTTTDELVDVDDTTDGVQGIALMGDNPWRGLWANEAGDTLWVGSAGDSFARDGFIEEVSLTTHESVGVVLDESTMDAELEGFAVARPGRVLVQAGGDVLAVDPAVDFPADPEVIVSGIDGMLLLEGELFTWARSGDDAGLRRFAAGSGTETTPASGPWDFGMPIYGIAGAP